MEKIYATEKDRLCRMAAIWHAIALIQRKRYQADHIMICVIITKQTSSILRYIDPQQYPPARLNLL